MLSEDRYDVALSNLETFYKENPLVGPIKYVLVHFYSYFKQFDKAKAIKYELQTVYREQHHIDQLKELRSTILQQDLQPDSERKLYAVDNDIILLSGDLERYINRLDSTYFILGYADPLHFQWFPPHDSIRTHPKFQEMLRNRDFTIRPRAEVAIKY